MAQIKKKKIQEKNPNETEISNLLDKEFKEVVIRMLNKLENRGIQREIQKRVRKYNEPIREEE